MWVQSTGGMPLRGVTEYLEVSLLKWQFILHESHLNDRGKTPSLRGLRGVCAVRSDRRPINRLSNGTTYRYSSIH